MEMNTAQFTGSSSACMRIFENTILNTFSKVYFLRICRNLTQTEACVFEFRIPQNSIKYALLFCIFDEICGLFPGWKWTEQKQCYLTAALSLSDKYAPPSGNYSC